jgi:copper chaperone NosL
MTRRTASLGWALATLLACTRGAPSPASLDTHNDACASCRMLVSDPRTAAQLLAPGEEPLFFDDLGCLARYLAEHRPPQGAVAYVADHRTRAWVPATAATYLLQPTASTPMGSHVLAYLDAASRDADPSAKGGRPLAMQDLFGATLQTEGR